MQGRQEDELSDTDDEDAVEVQLDVRPPLSLRDVAATFGGLRNCFLVSDEPPSTGPTKPIHLCDSKTENVLRVADVEKIYADLEGCLPPTLRKQF